MSSVTERATSHAPATAAEQRSMRRLLLISIPLFWSSLYVYNGYLSVYAQSVGASLSVVGIIVAAYGFTQLVLRIPLGIASDRLGKRKPFVVAGALTGALSSGAMLIAPQPWVLVLGRGLAGLSAACWVTLSVLLIASFPKDQVVKATSLGTAMNGLGMTLSSALGGQIAERWGPRVPFAVGIGLGLVTAVLLLQIKESENVARKPMSVRVLLGVGKTPLVLIASVLALFNQYISWAMTNGFVPIYAAGMEATDGQLGLLMSTTQACYALMALGTGYVSARIGNRWTAVLGFALTTLATVAVPLTGSIGMLFALRALHGVGMGLNTPVLMGFAMMAVPDEKRGAAMGFFQAIYAIGMVAGPAISGVLAQSLGLETTFFGIGILGAVTTAAAMLLLGNNRHTRTAH